MVGAEPSIDAGAFKSPSANELVVVTHRPLLGFESEGIIATEFQRDEAAEAAGASSPRSWRDTELYAWPVFQYIEGWFNPWRRHSSLGHLSPAEFERQWRAQAVTA